LSREILAYSASIGTGLSLPVRCVLLSSMIGDMNAPNH
jgi:hypothetical protein